MYCRLREQARSYSFFASFETFDLAPPFLT
jgi:hypothetical protein